MSLILMCILAYIAGSIPNALWVGKVFRGIDLREHGSKNTGATNAARVLGWKLGVTVLILDALKGAVPVCLAQVLKVNVLADMTGIQGFDAIVVGLCAILGHTFSVFLKFKGGKGVATTLGVFAVLAPKAIFVLAAIFFITFFVFKYVSLSSIISAACLPLFVYLFYKNVPLTLISMALGIIIIVKHKSNIIRLISGTENKFGVKKDGEK